MLEISELQPGDFPDVLALCKVAGATEGPTGPIDVRTLNDLVQRFACLSLVARVDGAVVAVILCGDNDVGTLHHRIMLAPQVHDSEAVARQLVDRALSKMISRGRHKSRMTWPTEATELTYWRPRLWQDLIGDSYRTSTAA